MHKIICVFELVILYLITLANEGKKTMFANDRIADAKRTEHFSYNSYTYTHPSFGITEEQNTNRVARLLPEP